MSRLTKAFIPFKGYYSSPFCRWQGSLANENAISLGATTANRWFKSRKLDPTVIDYLYFGITVAQHHLFYSHTWAAALLVEGKKEIPALMILQACTTPGAVGVALQAPVPVAGRRAEDAEAVAEEVRSIVARGCVPTRAERGSP